MAEKEDLRTVLEEIGGQFRLAGETEAFAAVGSGNIHSTYRVVRRVPGGASKATIFQKLNTFVFADPESIMENIERVTEHLRTKHPDRVTLSFYHTADGRSLAFDGNGGCWRVMRFLDGETYDGSGDLTLLRSAGAAFGAFQRDLADFDGSVLHETIPDFHNTRKRLDTLFAHAAEDPCGRSADVGEELVCLASVREKACGLWDRYARGDFPIRVTHNDTKLNNVLFERETKAPLAVIDLDTVMPGMAMYDFGDAVRFLANTAAEDERELSRVSLDTARFRAFAEGFLGEVKESLTAEELDAMPLGAFSVAVELASRFLDDYLTGDRYFRTAYPGHNLVRARCQLRLAQEIEQKQGDLSGIVREVCES